MAEYKTLSKEEKDLARKIQKLKNEKENREKSRAHRISGFFHRPDKVLNGINTELAKAEEKENRKIELAYRGYAADNEIIEARIKNINDTEKTATNEDEFLSGFEKPLSREQKDSLLDYATLAKLSTDEYLKLWRHLNPQYVSHVTRQGYRDHSAMVYHTAGLGEMANGFINTLKAGKTLQSFISLETGVLDSNLLDDKEALYSYMKEVYFKGGIPKSLLESENLSPDVIASTMGGSHGILSNPDGYWRDRTAVHVGANNVLNDHYGAESGNEIFYIFPADVVISQSGTSEGLLHRDEHTFKQKWIAPYTDEKDHNDVSVYAQGGLPIDAGLVFLPKSILVDPNTGSKYRSFNSETMTGAMMTKEMGGISAEEYWERYFKEHPEEKPAHIIYYDGNPETAVAKTLIKNGIYVGNHGDTSGETGDCLGFDDKIAYSGTKLDARLKEEAKRFFAEAADYIRSTRDKRSE